MLGGSSALPRGYSRAWPGRLWCGTYHHVAKVADAPAPREYDAALVKGPILARRGGELDARREAISLVLHGTPGCARDVAGWKGVPLGGAARVKQRHGACMPCITREDPTPWRPSAAVRLRGLAVLIANVRKDAVRVLYSVAAGLECRLTMQGEQRHEAVALGSEALATHRLRGLDVGRSARSALVPR